MAINHKTRRLGAWAIFGIAWTAVIVVSLAIVAIGVSLAGGAEGFSDWLARSAPYALIWRVGVYAVLGTLYITRWRPRLRAAQQRQSDGGDTAHQRLKRVERMLLVAVAVIEAANLPDLIGWTSAG